MTNLKNTYILAIDLGTSGSKTALATADGDIIDFEFQSVPLHLLPKGGAEQNPDDWWNAVMATSKNLLDKELIPRDKIVAICASTQWSGTVAVGKDGNHLMNAIIWMDMRGADAIKKIVNGPIKLEGYQITKLHKWIKITGGAPSLSGKDSIAHILFIKDQYPDIYAKTYKFLEPKDYINLCLTGKFAASYDSITIHWVTDNRDLSKVDYNDKLLKMATLDREKLPDLKRSIDVLGTIKSNLAKELGLNPDVKVIMGSPDVQAAALGSGAIGDYEGHIYIGTSSWLTAHIPFKKTDIFHNMASIPSAIPDRYIIGNEQETSGACLNFLRDNILYHKDELLKEKKQPDVFKIFDKIAERIPAGSNKLIFTPWLYGERTPVDSQAIRAGLYNLNLKSTRGDIIRAVLEGVAFNHKWLLKYVEKFIKRQMPHINMIGGGANSDVWCQIHADILDRKIQQVQDPIQANAKGSVYTTAIALGLYDFSEITAHTQIQNTFEPLPENRKLYDELFDEYLNIYKNNIKMYQRLNK